ncbi:hypothetical protein GCM10022388_22590 [Flavobacterium chungnamense]|uniref:PH domain-containing protein n=2 Tax=Flavobacterium chungnamense TaxID=706182 RepID=A0ABP7UY87_9FLAO
MKVTYKINKKSFYEPIKNSKWIYLTFLFYTIFTIYLFYNTGILIFTLLFLSIPFLLQIILHLDYYFNDKDTILEIDYSEMKIIQTKKNIKTEIYFDEIYKIIYFKGSKYPEKFGKYAIPSNFYNFTVIVSKDKKKIKYTDFILKDFGLFPIEKRVVTTPFLNLTNNII